MAHLLTGWKQRVLGNQLLLEMNGKLREAGGEGLFQNAMALFSVQFVRKVLPLITIPYLARVLGPAGWGLVATFQSLALSMALLIEFGFPYSATRRVVRSLQSPTEMSDTWAGVFGVQCLLAIGSAVFAGVLCLFVPLLRDHLALTAWSLAWAIAEGMNPSWYFLGMERMDLMAMLEIVSKVLITGSIIAVVHHTGDIWKVMALQAVAPILSQAVAMRYIARSVPFRFPTAAIVKDTLKTSFPLFMMRSAESFYTLSNGFLLGLLAGPGVVGFFAGPEKISRALIGTFNPIRETLYPRVSKLIRTSPAQAARLARMGMMITGFGGVAMGILVFLCAPLLVRIVLGEEFGPAIGVLRILSLLPPLISVTQSVGMGWLLPLGRDRVITRSMALGGLINLVLALILVPAYAHIGIACAVVCAEAFVCSAVLYAAIRDPQRRLPVPMPLESMAVDEDAAFKTREPVAAVPDKSGKEGLT